MLVEIILFSKKPNCILKKWIVHTIRTNTRKNGFANPHKIRVRGGKGSKGVSRFRELTQLHWLFYSYLFFCSKGVSRFRELTLLSKLPEYRARFRVAKEFLALENWHIPSPTFIKPLFLVAKVYLALENYHQIKKNE